MMLKLGGLALLVASVLGGFILAGGNPRVLWQPPEYVVIIGGAAAAFLISNSWHNVKMTGKAIAGIFKNSHLDQDYYQKLLTLLFQLFELRRRSGAAAMENHIEEPENSELFEQSGIINNPRLTSFICDNLRLVAMGKVQPHELDGLLESEINTMEDDLSRPAHSFQTLAEGLPGFGIVAAVLGIVITMGVMGGPVEMIGVSIAKALVGTLLGILLCYGLAAPIAQAIEHNVKEQVILFEVVRTAIVAQVSGRPSAIAVDAGRRLLYAEVRPSFDQMEEWLMESKSAS
ncbi:flagellar motor stator protein MotA [Endozoicomonas sp. OPT23]|uniref:flagellar motor stator protein MotA n=1 Tax=Endozoicomonas sp. OPT23 TaxID=2072845 RepID=UPI00129AAEAB|nr:flagellar motor stator protein MotA [Endozoicomonas sp. OPT23]MRI33912.1 flagellar motor stator protein MotA [Endozoicomonas sp. OPT23]